MANVYVVIVTYNAMKWAENCFTSLRSSSVPLKTIVIDNGSTDGTQDYIKNNFPEVDFIQSSENLGFGRANNIGIEKAYKEGADFFYLMNQDAWIFEDTFEKLLKTYEHYPNKEEIGILSPMHLDGSEKLMDIFFERYLARNAADNRIISDMFLGTVKNQYAVDFVNAAHWLLPKSTVENIGGFNPYFFHYSEDYEYVQRISYFGKKILICTESKVVHDGKQDFSKTGHINVKRVHREQRYLDPAREFSMAIFKKEFRSDIIKTFLKGNFRTALELFKEYQYQNNRIGEILAARKMISVEQASFLTLEK